MVKKLWLLHLMRTSYVREFDARTYRLQLALSGRRAASQERVEYKKSSGGHGLVVMGGDPVDRG